MSVPQSSARFHALDGLRGLFALAVVMSHCPVLGHFWDLPVVHASYLAVDFFFVLSGFVISHASASGIRDLGALRAFMRRRFVRVWPLHVVVLVCFVGLELSKWLALQRGASFQYGAFEPPIFDVRALPANVLLLQGLGFFSANTWNRSSWSISTEFYTYLLFALCTLYATKALRWIAIGLCALALLILFAVVPNMDTTYDFALVRCIAGFFVGHLVYSAYLARAQSRWPSSTMEIALALMVLAFLARCGEGKLSILSPLVFALPVWCFAFERGALSRVLRSRPFQALGTWSYGIYMVHEFVFVLLVRVTRTIGKRFAADPFVDHAWGDTSSRLIAFGNVWWMDVLTVLSIASVLPVAYAAYRYVERPALRRYGKARCSRVGDELSSLALESAPLRGPE